MNIGDTPVVAWGEFLPRVNWKQGQHVAMVGPTGQGKTTLALQLIAHYRTYRLLMATKPRDTTLAGLTREGYRRTATWPPPVQSDRVLLWPKWVTPADTPRQRAVIGGALYDVFAAGSWCVFPDDVQYLTTKLGLRSVLDFLWIQARSVDVSVVGATQRPVWVPREMWSQSTHLFMWGTQDDADLKAIGGFGGVNAKAVRAIVANLPEHSALYINARSRAMAITKAPARAKGGEQAA